MNLAELYKIFSEKSLNISTDTRKILPGDIFFALKGENFDGGEFVNAALEKGASFIVGENPDMPMDRSVFVPNALAALQEFAQMHRAQINIPVVAITGSNGKTTTKELARAVLEKKYKVLASPSSFNNHIGVPLTILSIKPEHEIAVIEMGDNHEGEIAALSEIAKPTQGLITNIGRDHIGEAGGYEANVRAKLELYDYFKKFGSVNFLNNDDPMLVKNSTELNNSKYVMGEILNAEDFLILRVDGEEIKTQFIGGYNIDNFIAAYTIGRYFEVPSVDIISALESYEPKNNRSQKIESGTNTIIMDAYNANPDSMKLALENFANMNPSTSLLSTRVEALESRARTKKIVILGDMFDLGKFAPEEHKKVLDQVESLQFESYFAGKEFYELKGDSENIFETTDKLIEYLKQNKIENSLVLLKGSRGMALEKILKENLL